MNVQEVSGIGQQISREAAAPPSLNNFQDVLKQVVKSANENQLSADKVLDDFSQGKADAQAVVLSAVRADLSFSFLVELRNKLTETYQDLSRMQF